MAKTSKRVISKHFSQILEFLNERNKNRSYYDLFITPEGQNYSNRVQELDTFVLKGSMFSIPFGEFISRMKKMIADGDLRRAIPESQIDEEGEEMLDCLELLLRTENSTKEETDESIAQLFSKEEIPYLLATLTFSLYTYLEAYSIDILDRLEESKKISDLVVERIQRWYEKHPHKKNLKYVDSIEDLRIPGLERRLRRIVIGLELEPILDEVFGNNHPLYKRLFKYFVETRHSLAHSDPAPAIEDYQHPLFQDRLQRFKKEVLSSLEETDYQDIPMENVFKPITAWFEELVEPLSRIATMSEIASVYPAMIDAGISIYA